MNRSTTPRPAASSSPEGPGEPDALAEAHPPESLPSPSAKRRSEVERPTIEITTDLHQVIDRCTEAMAAAPQLNLFQRDQQLVRVFRSDHHGPPVVRPISPATLREVLTRVACFQRYDGRVGGPVAILPSLPVVHALFDRRQWLGLRTLVGVVETPFLRTDGTICQRPGYDPMTGYLLVTRQRFPTVPDHPTQQDAEKALRWISDEVFGDFPFVSAAARAVPLAAILTLLARPALGKANIPLFAFDAATRGTGKTLAVDMICLLATGRSAPKTPYPSENAELEKLLGAIAREAAPILSFDNVHRPLGGDALDMALTCEGVLKVRILGKSEAPECTWTPVVFMTGNNVITKGDTGRRTLKARQETDLERPETREAFRHPDLRAWVTEHRAELVVAALTVLRAYCAAGRPELPGVRPLGSFVPWSKLIVNALAWAGGPHVLDALADAPGQETDPYQMALHVLFAQWPELCAKYGPEGLTAKRALEVLYPPRHPREPPPDPDEFEELREALEVLCPCSPGRSPDARTLGYKLRAQRSRVLDGRRLCQTVGHQKTTRWQVRPVTLESGEPPSDEEPKSGRRCGDGGDPFQPHVETVKSVPDGHVVHVYRKGPEDALPSPHLLPTGSMPPVRPGRERGWI